MKSITQRRIFSLLLSLAMLIGLLPALGSIASAAGSGTTEGDPRIVTTYAELSSALSSGVTYVKLGANITPRISMTARDITSPSNKLERFNWILTAIP